MEWLKASVAVGFGIKCFSLRTLKDQFFYLPNWFVLLRTVNTIQTFLLNEPFVKTLSARQSMALLTRNRVVNNVMADHALDINETFICL